MTRSIALLLLVACSSSSHTTAPTTAAPTTAAPTAPAKPACTEPSRLCELIALAETGNLDELAKTLYGDSGAAILAKLRARGLDPLIVDPGVVLRLDDLLAFPARPNEKPWQLRARFAANLGTVRVYRGLAVTPDELASINKQGILAKSARGTKPVAPKHLLDQLIGHLVNLAGDEDTMLSVSYAPDVSRCVAAMYMRNDTTKQVHIWTVEMPALDVLSIQAPHTLCPAVEPSSLDCTKRREITPATRLFMCRNFYDAKIESFVRSRIDPPEMVAVKADPRTDDCADLMKRVKQAMKDKNASQEQFCAPRAARPPAVPPPPGP